MNKDLKEFALSMAIVMPVIALVIVASWLLRDLNGEGPALVIMCIVCWFTGYKFLPWVAQKTARWF